MAADLPKEFDVIVLGTGMPESIVAAACSRIGQTVLHLDRNEYYSGDWASFSLQGVEKWAQQKQPNTAAGKDVGLVRPTIDETSLLEEGEHLLQLPLDNTNFTNVHMQYYCSEDDITDDKDTKTSNLDTKLVEEVSELNMEENSEGKENITTETVLEGTKQACDTNEDTKIVTEVENDKTVDNKTTKSDESVISENTEKVSSDKTYKTETDSDTDKADVTEATNTDVTKSTSQGKIVEDKDKKWTVKRLKSEWRKFNLDLSPKVVYSGGDMVDLLITSDIAKYCEFKTITRILTLLNGALEKVPCSRADVFSSKKVTMLEKRMLMKFLQFCVEYDSKPDEIKDYLDRPFVEFLTSRKLTPNVKHYIQHSIAMATDSMTTEQALKQMKKFLKSLGRYGNTAFLWSLYGSGELPQSFCRMCAVFGGLYCLRMSAASLVVNNDNRCTGIITTEGQRIKCKWLIMESSYAPPTYLSAENNKMISRAIILSDRPLLPTGQQELSLLCLPCPDDGERPVYVLELPPSSMAAPPGVYVFHLTRKCKIGGEPKEDLSYAMQTLFKQDESSGDDKPVILWSLYFCQCDMSDVQTNENKPDNVILMSGPGTDIDIDRPVQEAREIFNRILPEEEFLPKAPNPEDIIYVDDTETQVTKGNSQSEFKDSETDQSENKDRVSELSQSDDQEKAVENIDQPETSKDSQETIEQPADTENAKDSINQSEDISTTNEQTTDSESPAGNDQTQDVK